MRRTLRAALEESVETVGRIDAQVIVAHLLGVNRAYLATHPMRVLTEIEDAKIDTFVAQRALGAPVAYLVQEREFRGRGFALSAEVLIPRPETETLVDACLARLAREAAFLDLGTGSGVIAVTIACERPDAALTATDVSVHALDVARSNAVAWRCEERIELVGGSWYAPLAGRRYDMIASNPPYIPARDPHLAQGDLRFEPAGALTDGSADGLDSIRAIVRGAPAHLRPGGWLLFEHGYDQSAAARALLEAADFRDIVSIDDLAGIARVAGGKMQVTHRRQGMSAQDRIREQVTHHPVVLYMKGSPQQPMCGFSATATQLLRMSGAGEIFTVDVLQDPEIREGIKQYANWPTIPQLYVNGEFVGGCDIMREMYQSGELQKLIANAAKSETKS